ncbi:hypothetical protein [Sphingosinicella soli]|uniref:EthD domain-containing protein n=1 Tax=Sphingosinicella soli TaxID=333708 RepID=A0A7W7B4G5_9SPHN|nr:hypothetical protein [Sphingosinicella soli]MBB4633838.1 hypothetical protein [Sphingosinicella soli]
MKITAFAQAPEGTDSADYKQWYLQSFAPSLLKSLPLDGLAVNVIRRAEALYEGAGAPPIADIYSEFWFPDDLLLPLAEIMPTMGTQQAFEVDERVEKAVLERRPGVMEGIKLLSPLYPVGDAPTDQSIGYWDLHVPLALRVHAGMTRYVRDIVVRPLNGASPIFGIASLHFPSDDAVRDEFFDSPDSIPVHAADLARFVGSVVPMSAISHVLQ